SYHDVDPVTKVDRLGLLCLAYKFPGSDARSFYLSDFASADDMASAFWKQLATESNGRVLYAHNASFDYAFVFDTLQHIFGAEHIKIIRLKNKIKAITVTDENGSVILQLQDTASLLYQARLRDLC